MCTLHNNCAFGQVTLCTVYTLHVCLLVVICLPLGLLKFFLFINSDLLQLICRSSSPNPASHLLTAVKDFQKWMEPYLAAFWGSFKVLSLQVHSWDIKRTELHYKPFSTCSRPRKPERCWCLCAFSMLLSLFTGTSYSPLCFNSCLYMLLKDSICLVISAPYKVDIATPNKVYLL